LTLASHCNDGCLAFPTIRQIYGRFFVGQFGYRNPAAGILVTYRSP
jgi:hypothetical protein